MPRKHLAVCRVCNYLYNVLQSSARMEVHISVLAHFDVLLHLYCECERTNRLYNVGQLQYMLEV